jgi:type I restriction enzyme S subunit
VLLGTERRITEAGLQQIGSGLLPAGTLLLSSRAPIGYLAIAQIPVAINQGFIAMPPGGVVDPEFLLFWTQFNMPAILSRAGGTTFAEISKKNFRPLPMLVPSKKISHVFAGTVGPFISRIAANESESATLAALRDALLPRLLSGELSVRAAGRLVARHA